MAAAAALVATCSFAFNVYDVPLAVYEIAESTFNDSPLANC